ncbi:MAG: DNA polymerase III subunit delta [Tepidibacter sp.]|jgi:DNA polymerase-3 subunit delta|uniref:DNA polymerase III subunit delta n=1 Tax=Tepidibacter sp. TaxID=2529387 RepID=UPI0025DA5B87|nr:DNA polymerase III subunit delta [Tepidibacter sp.]MCT4507207.1 DNA polymerase III subunit delta [Tepidibacter sp.]
MKYGDIIKDIKINKYEKIYTFYGKETYLIDKLIKKFKEGLNSAFIDFNFSTIDGSQTSLDEIISSLETIPFMDDRKIIVIKNFELLTNKKKNFTQKDEEEFCEYIKNTPDYSILIFVNYSDIDKRKKFSKELGKSGILLNCNKLDNNELFKWAQKRFKKENVEIERPTLNYFLNNIDYQNKNSDKTLSDIENEIIKVTSFVGSGKKVSISDVDKLSSKKIENDIFKLIDFIGNKNASEAIKILNDMIVKGESPLMVLSMISRQFKIIIQAKELNQKGNPEGVISKSLAIHPYVIKKALIQSRKFDNNAIIKLQNELLKADYSIKNGLKRDVLALEIIISKFCI